MMTASELISRRNFQAIPQVQDLMANHISLNRKFRATYVFFSVHSLLVNALIVSA